MKRTASLASVVVVSLTLSVIFQNCGSYTGTSLTDGVDEASCEGVSCTTDLSFVEIQVANAMPIGLAKPTTALTSNACTSPSACLDVSGYCNTSGYVQSFFYYQWRLNNSAIGNRVPANTTCDAMGRFRVLVQIPPTASYTMDYTKLYSVDITMTILDENGLEQENPSSGISTKQVPVTGI